MKIQVTLNSIYKLALVEETYDDDNSDRALK